MAAKKKVQKNNKASATTEAVIKAVDPREPIKPTPAALKDTIDLVRAGLAKLTPPAEPKTGDLVHAMAHMFLCDGLPDGYGQEAVHRLESGFVDRNEFRVTEAFEVADMLADLGIPDLFDRCMALREAISQVYNDQNSVSLDLLREASVSERSQFFQRVPAITPAVQRFVIDYLSFEECVFSDRSTMRVQMRLGFDPKSSAVQQFFADLKEALTPWGHLPLQVGPQGDGAKPILEPLLSPAGHILRLAPSGKKK